MPARRKAAKKRNEKKVIISITKADGLRIIREYEERHEKEKKAVLRIFGRAKKDLFAGDKEARPTKKSLEKAVIVHCLDSKHLSPAKKLHVIKIVVCEIRKAKKPMVPLVGVRVRLKKRAERCPIKSSKAKKFSVEKVKEAIEAMRKRHKKEVQKAVKESVRGLYKK